MAEKEEYRLGTLLKLREQKKESAERYLAECLRALELEQERQQTMERELERMIAKREAHMRAYAEKAMRGEMSAQSAISANAYVERLKEHEESQKTSIESQKAVVAQKQEDVDGARRDLTDASQELKALEKHREKWEDEAKKKQMARDEQAMDELAQSIYLKRS